MKHIYLYISGSMQKENITNHLNTFQEVVPNHIRSKEEHIFFQTICLEARNEHDALEAQPAL